MTENPVRILHQEDVEAVIDGRILLAEVGEVVLGDAATMDVGTGAGTVAAGDDARFLQVAAPVVSTTTALAAVANAINTTGKVVGKEVFNSSTGKPVYATGVAAADVWNDATGTLAHTPV